LTFCGAGVPDEHHDFDPTKIFSRKTTERAVEAGRGPFLRVNPLFYTFRKDPQMPFPQRLRSIGRIVTVLIIVHAIVI